MGDRADRYVIAIRREKRKVAPEDWITTLLEVDGLDLVGHPSGSRIVVDANADAINEVRDRFSSLAHIEPMVVHRTLDSGGTKEKTVESFLDSLDSNDRSLDKSR